MQKKGFLAAGLALVLVTFAGCVAYGPYQGPAHRTEVRLDLFYDDLAPFGEWVLIDAHGWVWIPRGVPVAWRPYTHGQWVYTTAGWTWYSYWDWGWAPFHYGRWLRHDHHGWVWIPGRTWGPGWVAWRAGDGWMGWAPLPPGVSWRVGVGLDWNGVDLNVGIASNHWSFVPVSHMADHRMFDHLAPVPRNAQLLRSSRDVTRYRDQDRIVAEHGVGVERIERELGRAIPRYRVEDLRRPPKTRDGRLDEGVYRSFRPQVKDPRPGKEPSSRVGGKKRGKG